MIYFCKINYYIIYRYKLERLVLRKLDKFEILVKLGLLHTKRLR